MTSLSVSPYFASALVTAVRKLLPNFQCATPLAAPLDPTGSNISLTTVFDYLNKVSRSVDNADIGLLLGQQMAPSCFNVQGQLVMACATVGEAMPVIERFHRLIINGAQIRWLRERGYTTMSWSIASEQPLPRIFIDLVMAATCEFGVWITGGMHQFAQVRLSYLKPVSTTNHARIFGSAIEFGAKENAIMVPEAWEQLPILTASRNLKPLLCEHAQQLLNELDASDNLRLRIEAMVERLLGQDKIGINALCSDLGLSRRTLQRYLSQQDLCFSQLLQEIRLRKAQDYLQRSDLSLTEISFRLGYLNSSSFSKAYKEWTGCTPKSARKNEKSNALATPG